MLKRPESSAMGLTRHRVALPRCPTSQSGHQCGAPAGPLRAIRDIRGLLQLASEWAWLLGTLTLRGSQRLAITGHQGDPRAASFPPRASF